MKAFLKRVFASALGVIVGSLLVFTLMPMIIFALFKGSQGASMMPIAPNSILHVRLDGSIVEKRRPLDFGFIGNGSIFQDDRTIGLYELNRAIDVAKKDDRIKGMYLELRNFDGGWASVTALRRKIEDFAASGKWVYAYGDRYDEMAYYLASAGTRIHMHPHGDIEFNGLGLSEAFLKGLFAKLELEPRIFRVGKFKAAVEPLILEKMSDENRVQNQELIGDLWQPVRDAVAQVTKGKPEKVDEMAANLEVVSADDAKRIGLVHETWFVDEVEKKLREETVGEDAELELVGPSQLLSDPKVVAMKKSGTGNKIALVFAEGDIVSGDGGMGKIGSESFRQDILDAKKDEDVVAVVVRINSPGGDALASDVIWRELRLTDDEIPVVISMGDMAASGGYYMAAAGRYIFAEPTTITGSIGVFGLMFNTEKFFKNKVGVGFDRVVTHPFADIGNSNRPMTDRESGVVQGEVERIYKRFLDVVQEGRGYEKRGDLENIAEGRIWSGAKAKELGLVDELGGLDQAITKAAEFAEIGEDYRIEIFPAPKDRFREILDRISGDVAARWMGGEELLQLQRMVHTVTNIKSGIYARIPFDLRIR